MTVTLTKYPTALLNKIGSFVCQAIIYIQQQQPELLLDKYRSISWRDNSNQSRLKAKLIEVIGNAQDWESLVNQVEVFIKALLISNSTNTPVLIKLQEKIRQLNPHISESNNSSHLEDVNSPKKESNIQILVNLKIWKFLAIYSSPVSSLTTLKKKCAKLYFRLFCVHP